MAYPKKKNHIYYLFTQAGAGTTQKVYDRTYGHGEITGYHSKDPYGVECTFIVHGNKTELFYNSEGVNIESTTGKRTLFLCREIEYDFCQHYKVGDWVEDNAYGAGKVIKNSLGLLTVKFRKPYNPHSFDRVYDHTGKCLHFNNHYLLKNSGTSPMPETEVKKELADVETRIFAGSNEKGEAVNLFIPVDGKGTPVEDTHYKLISDLLVKANGLLTVKAKEYVRNGDVFHNFIAASKMNNKTPLQALEGFKLKHDVSIKDLYNDYNGGKDINPDQLQEKTLDIIVYLCLAYSMIKNNVR